MKAMAKDKKVNITLKVKRIVSQAKIPMDNVTSCTAGAYSAQ